VTDWRELERARVADLEARGIPVPRVSWTCHHSQHEPPQPVKNARTKAQRQFGSLIYLAPRAGKRFRLHAG
jgi:hypothetical protein